MYDPWIVSCPNLTMLDSLQLYQTLLSQAAGVFFFRGTSVTSDWSLVQYARLHSIGPLA
jgi:hypothetical protein